VSFGDVGTFATATATAAVALAPTVTGKEYLDLRVMLAAAEGCGPSTFPIAPLINVVEVPESSTMDDVEARGTTWTPTGMLADKIWSRVEATPGNHLWAGIDYAAPSDTALVSPPLVVSSSEPLVMTFTHRHSFESSMGVNWDGAVIEVSADGGSTWVDVKTLGDPGYGGKIGDPTNMAKNVLDGRQGYVATNPSWPNNDKVAINMGGKLAGQTVQVRFRIGTDDSTGDVGWRIDDIGFQGITNQPFAALVADTTSCNAPVSLAAASGAGGGTTTTSTPGNPDLAGEGGGHVYASGGCGCRASGEGAEGEAVAVAILGIALLGGRRRSPGVWGRSLRSPRSLLSPHRGPATQVERRGRWARK
jgi:MYXO-CTERM domain-containing protein